MRAALVASLGALAAAWEGGPRSAACAVAADACPETAHAGLAALRCGTSYYPDAYSFATNATQTRLRDAAVRARVCARPPTRAAPRPDLSLGKFFYYGVAWRRVPFQSTPSILARACRVARDLGATVCSGSPITGDAPASFLTRVRRDVRRGRPSRALPWESAPGCCTRADGETRPRTGHRQEGARRHPPLLGGAVRRPASVSGSSPAPSTRLPRRPFQHTRPELAAWRFLPRGGCGATQDDWFAPPACAGVVDPPRGTVENDVDLPPGLWRLAAGVRHRLAGAGPCAATARDQLLGPLRRAAGRGLTAGVHVRRGDACERFGDEGDPTLRACYPAGAYAAALRRMRRTYGVQRVAVATDSPTVVGELRRLLPGFAVEALAFDRHRLGGAENATLGRRAPAAFIENRADLDARHALVTFLADLELLAAADVFVGTAGTTIGRAGLVAMIGRLGRVPPFEFVDGAPSSSASSVV